MHVKILGSGCANCAALEKAAREAAADLGLDATFEKVTNYGEIIGYGVLRTPALVVDEKLLLAGRVPSVATLKDLLAARAG